MLFCFIIFSAGILPLLDWNTDKFVEIRIQAKYMTTKNKEVSRRQVLADAFARF